MFKGHTFIPKETKLLLQLNTLLVALDFLIDIAIFLLRNHQVSTHFIHDIHKSFEELFFLLVFVVDIETLKGLHFKNDILLHSFESVYGVFLQGLLLILYYLLVIYSHKNYIGYLVSHLLFLIIVAQKPDTAKMMNLVS